MLNQALERTEVIITDPGQRDIALNEAEAALRTVAMEQRCAGILVTRHNCGSYTLELSETVPYGETREKTTRARAAAPSS